MDDIVSALAGFWAAQAMSHGTGATDEEIAAGEARWGHCLGEDARACFRRVNGMESPTGASPWDAGLIRFYPFAECRVLTEEVPDSGHPRAHSLLCFTDYSVWCWGYAIDLEDPANPVHVVFGSESVKVADSFRAFLVGYLAGDRAVTHPR